MKTTKPTQALLALAAAGALLAVARPVHAANFSSSTSAPAVNSTDIANYGAQTGTDKWFFQSADESSPSDAAKGQTFTNGPSVLLLKAVTYKISSGNLKAAPTTWTIRIGTVAGTSFTLLRSEQATQTVSTATGAYMTWTLASPVSLAPNTAYAVDVGMKSGVAWTTGIPYLSYSGNTNNPRVGLYYDSGDRGFGSNTVTFTAGRDRVFHIDLEDPILPSPPDGAIVTGGNVPLLWRNLTPTNGPDVWVNVWFGTNTNSLAKIIDTGLNTTNVTVSAPVAATYYWRVDSYLSGAPAGSPRAGNLLRFFVTDTDGDGLPDSFELAHTTPPSSTALNPGDDLDSDGLTNLQEYQRGTLPRDADTDNDGLNDGPELTGVGARPATNPLLADTDGDGLNDGVESNTGVWGSSTNRGTHPINPDTDRDGLRDGVESNTGVFVSASNAGTSPLNSDSDGDSAGDWYEVTATFTSPTDAAQRPNVPYPLPDPDGSTGSTNKRVKVYILSGQSNMVGFGRKDGDELGTLETLTVRENKFPNLITGTGAWTNRSDVKYRGVISAIGNGPLGPSFGANANSFGPELGFGQVMGWYHDEPVLLIKASIGNRSLLWDIAPPGSPRFNYGANTHAGYGDSPNSWPTVGGPSPFVWYAGKQYDDFFLDEEDMGPTAWASGKAYPSDCQVRHRGAIYVSEAAHASSAANEPGVGAQWSTNWNVYSVFNTIDVLDNFATQYPQWAAQGFEIAGFAWWQGFNDMSEPAASRYERNLTNLIHNLRAYYSARYPGKVKTNAPFVLGTIAFGGWSLSGDGLDVANAQLAVGNPALHPEFAGNVKTMEARGYYRSTGPDTSQGHHYNHNAETYMLLGDALGRGMIEMSSTTPVTVMNSGPWSGASFPLTFSGPNGQGYQVLRSTNVSLPMVNWTVLRSGTFGPGPATFTDTNAAGAQQFYRIKSP